MRVLITGATGLVGQEITRVCHQSNINVNYLTTNRDKIKIEENYKGFFWNPGSGEIDLDCFEEVEVIIHLAGASIAKRWTKKYKKEIIDSRVLTTALILESLKTIQHTVRHIVSASAVGIYPDSFQKYYMEDAEEKSTDFLGEVVKQWEAAVMEFKNHQIEVSLLRIGLVLASSGGAFPKISKPVKQGLGAVFGNGKQWQSWIHLEDLALLFMFVVEEELKGVFNAVAPNPVSNKKLTHIIATKVGKKIVLPNVPKFVMRLILGEMHMLLFSSQRVCSNKTREAGFYFNYDNVTTAVDSLIE
ncbi:TIGR01777 family oxidoreductase [Aquimarina sp. RZ0]|uniref:TIGR01777 family oxidoreductase n=1 Tax=Aquimarina sp. RZ0 TaxID=2607730 RepID=UPI0011F3B2F4|nr:TIGR01777 family oxidoreductase [Aquimarina sp. RZ0]KAA1245633.1 TIGR01777 family protein [Aquimarina sp. RZ0]